MSETPGFVTYDPAFADVLGETPRLVKVVDTDAHEGPVWSSAEDALYFTSLPVRPDQAAAPVVAIRRLALDGTSFPVDQAHVTTIVADANAANGMALDGRGRLVVCEQGGPTSAAAVSLVDPADGSRTTAVDAWHLKPLSSPNDVVVRSDGTIWFTDPSYGHLQGFRPEPATADQVYRYDPVTGRVCKVADGFDKPNGLAFSPDERTLYVTDSGANQEQGSYHIGRPHHVIAFDVRHGRHLGPGRIFAVVSPGTPDGIKVDSAGRVYVSSASGVQVYAADGARLGEIALPGAVNFTFGGPRWNVLYITTDDAIWAAVLRADGQRPPAATRPPVLKGA